MMKLYDFELSGNCYKARLFLGLIGAEYERVPVDVLKGEHRAEPFLRRNPKGQLPVLADGGLDIPDSQAILVYLARKFAAESWFPEDAEAQARVQFWLATAANEVQNSLALARLVKLFKVDADYDAAVAKANNALSLLESSLEGRDWLASDHPTIAEAAVFPYVALAENGEVSLAPYPRVRAWIERVKGLPGFTPMPGLFSERSHAAA